jgi:hypothetical protein
MGRLLIKYSASDCDLEVCVGCLAQIRDAGGTACGIAEAIHALVALLHSTGAASGLECRQGPEITKP